MRLCVIGARDISDYMKYQDAILVDLREPEEYRRYHIPGAINIPAKELPRFMRRTDKSRIHIFYCEKGSLSFQEGKKYVRAGFRICSLAGGIEGYRRH